MAEIESFEESVQKRLKMIEKNWKGFTAFYFVEGAPATNNPVENYYGASLKTQSLEAVQNRKGTEEPDKTLIDEKGGDTG
uniref:Transposase n=1 Tax=Candidatus Methanogaster sp. ANME-2c ERB4 TaxID=2759911 RepID=A0A7G9YF80_9EURY|nr:hypothetical protein LDPDHNFI_00018 [Methanosarcinales archaeon ANME-2c ERB4]